MKEDLGNGFLDHGVATPVSNHRGTVATADGDGGNVVLVWLFDHRGGYALLQIDAATGASHEVPMPFDPGGDCPFASILSSRNRYYTHFNNHFCEYDPARGAFTFHHETVPQMAMGMTEDDAGRIWSVTYPDSAVACYDPATGTFRDYGSVYAQNWRQYQRSAACDDTGWLYFAIGNTASQIIALDPDTGAATPLLAEEERRQGSAAVYRDEDGRVYGQVLAGDQDSWLRLHGGQSERLGRHDDRSPKAIVAESQSLFHTAFPDGATLIECNTVDKRLVVEDAEGTRREMAFDYTSEGAHLMGLATAPDGTICGGTAFPMRFFRYDPVADDAAGGGAAGSDAAGSGAARSGWTNRASFGQWNTVRAQADRFFVGGYTGGFLLEWDPARAWEATEKEGGGGNNPRWWTECAPAINRPHCLLATEDGRWVVLGGTPGYGYTGGGLLIWDRQAQEGTLLEHTDLVAEQAPMSALELPGDRVLIGTTVQPGTGGEQKAELAEMLIVDLATKAVTWRGTVLDKVGSYTDLCAGPDGLVLGFADSARLFAYDPVVHHLVQEADVAAGLGRTCSQQGPRVFVKGPQGRLFVLLVRGVAEVVDRGAAETSRFAVELRAESPVPVGPGGDCLDGRIYFGSGSHMYSWQP